MTCPECSGPTSVVRTHVREEGRRVRRRRECGDCGLRFSTDERLAEGTEVRATPDTEEDDG